MARKIKSTGVITESKKLRIELERRKLGNRPAIQSFQESLEELRLKYEQYFLGIEKFPPEEARRKLVQLIRKMKLLPHKSAEDNFKINSIEQRYYTLNTLWDKSLREKENGTYKKDLFKAKISDAIKQELKSKNIKNLAESSLVDRLLEDLKATGKAKDIPVNYEKLKKILFSKLQDLQKKHGDKDFGLELEVRDGKLGIRTFRKEKH